MSVKWGQVARHPELCWQQQGAGPEASCAHLQAILLLVPAFLLVGWGRTLPVLGFGLLFYSFGEWSPCRGRGGEGGRDSSWMPPVPASPVV